MSNNSLSPVSATKRYVLLDALRGFAVLGICLANYPEFSLYTFQSEETMANMPTAEADNVLKWLMYIFIDGKFYTLFSLLFGIGFSIILSNALAKGSNGLKVFYRRMSILIVIGFVHLAFIWSGDILMLYALLGMLLPLFRNSSDKSILTIAAIMLLMPVVVDSLCAIFGISLSAPAVRAQWYYCDKYGITEENFGYWLRDADSYKEVFQFLVQGAMVRIQEFVDGNRYFKVFGLFLIGYYIGRNKLYANINEHRQRIKKVMVYAAIPAIPLSIAYAWSGMNGKPFGTPIHTLLYTLSIYPMDIVYLSGFSLLFMKHEHSIVWKLLAAPGRMALTNYIFQSVFGMFIFYGIGFGVGTHFGLIETEATAIAVYIVQMAVSMIWLHSLRFGPMEWIWRILTYGKLFRLRK